MQEIHILKFTWIFSISTLRGHINTSKERRKKSHHFLRRIPFLQNGLPDQHLYCCCCCCSGIKLSSQKHFSSTKHSICSYTKKVKIQLLLLLLLSECKKFLSFFEMKKIQEEREKKLFIEENVICEWANWVWLSVAVHSFIHSLAHSVLNSSVSVVPLLMLLLHK